MPKTLRPSSSSSRSTTRTQSGGQPHGSVNGQCDGQQRLTSDAVGTDVTSVPSPSSSHYPTSAPDLPDSVPLPPPPPSLPPPAPPLFPPPCGKLLPLATPGSGVVHPADPGTTSGPSVPLAPPGPAPILPSMSEPLPVRSQKSHTTHVPDRHGGIDLASIEAARQRLKKPTKNNTSGTCEFYVLFL